MSKQKLGTPLDVLLFPLLPHQAKHITNKKKRKMKQCKIVRPTEFSKIQILGYSLNPSNLLKEQDSYSFNSNL